MCIHAMMIKLTTIIELRTHQSYEKHYASRFSKDKGWHKTGKPYLSICELPGRKGIACCLETSYNEVVCSIEPCCCMAKSK